MKEKFVTDTGISKSLINRKVWRRLQPQSQLIPTSKGFRPYGPHYRLPIIGRAHVTLKAANGAEIKTWVYVLNNDNEQSLLGEKDGIRLGIVSINPDGATEEVVISEEKVCTINHVTRIPKQTKAAKRSSVINESKIYSDYKPLFSNKTGKCNEGGPIPIQLKDPTRRQKKVPYFRRVPVHYKER